MRFEFVRPEFLYLLLLLPLWILIVWPRRGSALRFTRPGSAGRFRSRASIRAAAVLAAPRVLRLATVSSLILALAGPVRVQIVEELSSTGIAMALAVDLSTSMLAEDMGEGSRLDIARAAAVRFARRRASDELALIVFAGQAFTRVPPTTDESLIVAGVQSLQVDLIRNGTDISGAVLTSVKRLADSEREPKVIVLLSDGAHNAAGILPLAAARAAAAEGVRIHSIALGPAESSEPGTGSSQSSGAEAESVLSAVASLTGGRYFRAHTSTSLDSIYARVDQLESPLPSPTEHEERRSERAWVLAFALALIACDALLRASRLGVVP